MVLNTQLLTPVVLIDAGIGETGLAESQIVSPHAQVRSDGYQAVSSQCPDVKPVGEEIANRDRQTGQDTMGAPLSENPDAGPPTVVVGRSCPAQPSTGGSR